jgi:hypothetical protein
LDTVARMSRRGWSSVRREAAAKGRRPDPRENAESSFFARTANTAMDNKTIIARLSAYAEDAIADAMRIQDLETERDDYQQLTRDLVAVGAQLTRQLKQARRRIKELEHSPRPPKAHPVANREFTRIGEGAYRLAILDQGIQMDVTRLRWERGELFGLLDVRCDIVGAKAVDGCISAGTFNLTSVSARTSRAKELITAALAPEIDFRLYLEEICQRTIRAEQEGHPVILLSRVVANVSEEATAWVYGLPLLLKHPTIWYGHGGTGKSTLALGAAGELERQGVSVLFLDWETNETTNHALLTRLFGSDLPDVKYRRCERPLSIEGDSIARQVTECGIDYVICDSAGFGSDGRPEDAEVALRFTRALRQFRTGSLTLAHMSSGEHGTDKPFGSVFWHNSARATWYLERDQDNTGSNEIVVAATNKKNNLGRLLPAMGLSICFDEGRTTISKTDLAEHEQHAAKLPLGQRLRHVLQRGGAQTIVELAEELDAKVDSVEKALKRGKQFMRISAGDGIQRWGLAERRIH